MARGDTLRVLGEMVGIDIAGDIERFHDVCDAITRMKGERVISIETQKEAWHRIRHAN